MNAPVATQPRQALTLDQNSLQVLAKMTNK